VKITQDVLAMAMTVAPMLLDVLVVIAMLRDRDQEKAQEATLAASNAARRAQANALSGAAQPAARSVVVDVLDAPSNN
jgi:hypothetical protein